MDQRHLCFLYRRPPGLLSPDDARTLPAADLTQLATGAGEQVRCRLYPDGRAELERSDSGAFLR